MDQYILDLIWFNIPEFSYVDVTSDPIWQIKVYCMRLSENSYFVCSSHRFTLPLSENADGLKILLYLLAK